MTNFLTYTDFTGLFNFDLDSDVTITFLDNIISQAQKKVLIDLLGIDLYNQFETGLAEVTPEQKWLDLRDGAKFEADYNGKTYNLTFSGVKEMLKYYISAVYLKEITKKTTFAGKVSGKFENSQLADATHNIVKYQLKFVELYGLPYDYDSSIVELIGDRIKIECETEKLKDSCFNFIYSQNEKQKDTYSNWVFTTKKYQF